MSLPQWCWDIIRNDKRFKSAAREAKNLFLRGARAATWNMGKEHSRKAATIFSKGLDETFGPHPDVMQRTLVDERKYYGP